MYIKRGNEFPSLLCKGRWSRLVGSRWVRTLGQSVATLVSEKQFAGRYKVEWDASSFASGLYFYRLETDQGPSTGSGHRFVQTRKLIVLKY